jgi:prepilin-type N-terminal cleavage/methylation domain-containing protein
MRKGFSLIEFIIATSLLVIVSAVAIKGLNPAGQLSTARNNQRTAHVNTLVNLIKENISDGRTGRFICTSGSTPGDIPTSSKKMASGSASSTYDIAPCLVPSYVGAMPYDPRATGAHYTSNTDYDTGYFVIKNATTGQITVSAPSAENNKVISVVR